MGGGWKGKCPPSNILLSFFFFGYYVDEGQVKIQKYFQNNYLGGAVE